MATKRERRKWALELSAALLHSDMDCFVPSDTGDDFDEDEGDRRVDAVRAIAKELQAKADRMHVRSKSKRLPSKQRGGGVDGQSDYK